MSPTPDEVFEEAWRSRHLAWCLEQVKERESERNWRAFEMLLVEECGVPEVCEALGLNANQVYKAKSRVLQKVREAFERLGTGAVFEVG